MHADVRESGTGELKHSALKRKDKVQSQKAKSRSQVQRRKAKRTRRETPRPQIGHCAASRKRMTNDEALMTNQVLNPNVEARTACAG